VIGAGIGGLAAALSLARKGRHVHVIEKAPRVSELGAGLQLAPNASRVLDHLGVLRELHKHAVFPSRLVWMDALSGKEIMSLDLGEKFRQRYGYPYFVMHRSDLLDTLHDACRSTERVTIETSREVTSFEAVSNGTRVTCKDGSFYDGEAVIAADGLWSTARKWVGDDGEPECARFVAYRGTLAMDQVPLRAALDAVVMWTGPNMHLVQYPIRRGELYNQVACFKSERYAPDHDDWGTVAELEAHFAGACSLVRDALRLVKRDRRWPLFDRAPTAVWTRGNLALLGDAAHPMLQYLAQGAAQALEDAEAIADQLERADRPIAESLLAYQEARLLRTARVQLTARFFGEFIHVGGVGLDVRNALLAGRSPERYFEVDWLYREMNG
jgi:salicylate hydroxylase